MWYGILRGLMHYQILVLKTHYWLPSLNGGYTVDCAISELVQTYSKVPWLKVVWGKHKALLLENVYLTIYHGSPTQPSHNRNSPYRSDTDTRNADYTISDLNRSESVDIVRVRTV